MAAAASGEYATYSSPTLHRDGAEVAGARRVGVADGAGAVGDGVDDAGGALRGLAALDGQTPSASAVQTSGAAASGSR